MSGIFDQVINYAPPSLLLGTVTYKGTWSAATNTPTLPNPPSAITNGNYYVVSAAGTQFSLVFNIGDWIISNGSAWEKVDNTDAVSSVFGRTGAVVGVSTDYSSVGITATAVGASSPSTGAFTTLSATTPLAVASGGTGVASSTGTTNVVLSGSPTITTPVIAQINDANGNETLKLASIASAVNEVTIENAATGNAVHISATGGDASVGLHLAGKGASGYVNVQDSTDATKRIMFNASGGTTNTRTMLSSTQTVDRTLSLPDATDTLVGKATTDTLTNKTLTSPTITGGALNGTLGATTPSSVAATTGTFSSTLGVTGVATLGNGAILGTPASGTVTNLTGTASININGTVGATTPSTVAGTTGTFSGNGSFNGATNTHALNVRGATGFNLQVRSVSSALTLQSANNADTASVAMNFLGSSFVFLDDALVARATITSTGLQGAIGATTPSTGAFTTLAVSSTSSFDNTVTILGSDSLNFRDTGVQLYSSATNIFKLYVGGADRLSVDTTGLAVTGTLSNTNTITVSGTSATGSSSINLNASDYSSGPSYTTSSLYQNGNSATGTSCGLANAGLGSLYFQNVSNALIWTNSGVSMVFGTANAERMRINATGLAVTGAINVTGTTAAGRIGSTIYAGPATSGSGTGYAFRIDPVPAGHGEGLDFGNAGGYSWIQSRDTANYATNFELSLNRNGGVVTCGAGLTVTGALSKGSGSFRIEHPLPSKSATHQLVHSFIEGPKCDLIYRGKVDLVDGKASVNIDADSTMTEGTFEALCATVQCFTSNESGWGAIRGKVIGNILTIEAQDAASTDNVSWMVIGERKDKHIMDTDWTDKNGRPIVEPLKPAEPALESK